MIDRGLTYEQEIRRLRNLNWWELSPEESKLLYHNDMQSYDEYIDNKVKESKDDTN